MKWCASIGFCVWLCLAGCAFSAELPSSAESDEAIEQRKFTVRVISYDIECAVMDANLIEHTAHLDCLVFDILVPEDLKGKRWHLFIHNQVWSAPVDYGYRPGNVLEIDVPKFGITKRELAEMMASTEWMRSVWIPNDLIKRVEPDARPNAAEPPPQSGTPPQA